MRMAERHMVIAVAVVICAAAWAAGQITPADEVVPPTTDIPREGCVTAECHPGIRDHEVLHGPINVHGCDSCHRLADVEAHRFEPTRPESEMCSFCHTAEVPDEHFRHAPFAEGKCIACHDPHGGDGPRLLRGRYQDICKSCHQDLAGDHEVVHGPVSAGACGACHEPHAAPNRQLLAASGRELCLRCHVTIGIKISSMPVVHEPAHGNCEVCHDPHATDSPSILNAQPSDLCIQCHEHIGTLMENATTQHGAVTTVRACMNCHDPHAADRPRLLRDDPKALCFECHDQPIELDDGTHLMDIRSIIESKKSLHGAIARSSCVTCHDIHGGGHQRLLVSEYPNKLYYPFLETGYALCFSCHDKQMVLLEETAEVTAFRNGTRNLHFEHVNRDKKGRTCRICHDAHAADRERHIRDAVPFGPAGWMLPIKFERTDDGGQCAAGCHRAYAYDRVEPVVYPSEAPEEDWKGDDLVPGTRAEPPPEEPADEPEGDPPRPQSEEPGDEQDELKRSPSGEQKDSEQ